MGNRLAKMAAHAKLHALPENEVIEDADLKDTAVDIISKLVGMTDKEFADLGV